MKIILVFYMFYTGDCKRYLLVQFKTESPRWQRQTQARDKEIATKIIDVCLLPSMFGYTDGDGFLFWHSSKKIFFFKKGIYLRRYFLV